MKPKGRNRYIFSNQKKVIKMEDNEIFLGSCSHHSGEAYGFGYEEVIPGYVACFIILEHEKSVDMFEFLMCEEEDADEGYEMLEDDMYESSGRWVGKYPEGSKPSFRFSGKYSTWEAAPELLPLTPEEKIVLEGVRQEWGELGHESEEEVAYQLEKKLLLLGSLFMETGQWDENPNLRQEMGLMWNTVQNAKGSPETSEGEDDE